MRDLQKEVEKYKIISIARGIDPNDMVPLAQALYDGGIRILEITFAQHSKRVIEDTCASIAAVKAALGDVMCVGAGTVLSCEQADAAKAAGAEFILSAVTDPEVIHYAKALGLGIIPGSMTPSEMLTAYHSGADLVKVFPAGDMGFAYIKSVRAPLSHIPMIAVGGVNEHNMMDFLNAGMAGVGIGSNLADKTLIEAGEFEQITRLARLYTAQLSQREGRQNEG